MRGDRYHEIFVQKIPIFHYTAISFIAVAHSRYCQEDPCCTVSSVNSWRTRYDILKKIPIFYSGVLYCHESIAGAHDVLSSNDSQ